MLLAIKECAKIETSMLVPYVSRFINLIDDNTPDHLLCRKQYVGKSDKFSFMIKFDYEESKLVPKHIFGVKHPFMIMHIDAFSPFLSLIG